MEKFCFGFSAADTISMIIKNQGLSVIPLDLAQAFFELDQKIRDNVKSVIKPKLKPVETETPSI